MANGALPPTIEWVDGAVRFIDQTRLPGDLVIEETRDYRRLADAIRRLAVRGAPALGVAGAMGVALAAAQVTGPNWLRELETAAEALRATRPTAVNLAWGVDRALDVARSCSDQHVAAAELSHLAITMAEEDLIINRALGSYGIDLVPDGGAVLTHCNAGALCAVGYGSALGVLRAARDAGKRFRVFADETRPLLQGARLTAFELQQDGFDVTLIADTMAGHFMRRGEIQAVIVGADRIAANGDVANKIGTYQVAVLARANNIPFYVAAPTSTVDLSTHHGDAIPIEERHEDEVTTFAGSRTAPAGISVRNPAFDVTPSRYVTSIVTERGLVTPPYGSALREVMARPLRQLVGAGA
jgi:methylthioribose-1-phosphate isomerase